MTSGASTREQHRSGEAARLGAIYTAIVLLCIGVLLLLPHGKNAGFLTEFATIICMANVALGIPAAAYQFGLAGCRWLWLAIPQRLGPLLKARCIKPR